VTYLERASKEGACLLVALNSNASARRQGKGKGRPFRGLKDRLAVIAALASVDAVTWFDEDTPAALIELLRPEVLVKGGDWPVAKIVGAKETRARGGRVLSIRFKYRLSSSALLKKIRKAGVRSRARPA